MRIYGQMTNDRIFCPDCGTGKNRRGDIVGIDLEVTERNYSGCAEDIMHCPGCGHVFAVSYKVAAIVRAQDWEDAELIAKLAKEKEERTAKAILRRIVTGTPEEAEAARKRAVAMFEERKAPPGQEAPA